MKVNEIYPNLFLFTFPNQYELTSTFFRIQEFYESPLKKIKGKYFTLEYIIDAYAYINLKHKFKDTFTYFTDWDGFNIPGHIVENFLDIFDMEHEDLMMKEAKLFDKLGGFPEGKFYFIGTIEGDEGAVKHELAHAFYYLNPKYKKEMRQLSKQIPLNIQDQVKQKLLGMGYSKLAFKDEIQAYFATGIRDDLLSNTERKIFCKPLIKKFEQTFNKYYQEIYNQWIGG